MAIKVADLSKTFSGRPALKRVSLDIAPGEMVAMIGASGSGKSTLLRHFCGLETGDTDAGEVEVLGRRVQRRGRLAADVRRTRSRVGFIFQQFNLVARLSVETNVLAGCLGRMPIWRSLSGCFTAEQRDRARAALARVGIAEQSRQRASTLSGGQQQRAAIARTLVQQAEVVLADEPIASLDPESSRRIMETLARINQEDGTTIVVSLHQVDFALKYCPRTIALKDGEIVYDGASSALTPASLKALYGAEAWDLDDGGDLTLGVNSFLGGHRLQAATAAI